MIFDRDLVTAMTSVIVMTKLPLQALISSVGGQFVAIISKGGVFLGTLNDDNYSGSLISSSMVAETKSGS